MRSKQDLVAARTVSDMERKYNFRKSFTEVMDMAEEAKDLSESLDGKLNQDEIFNRLTNNGKSQGVLLGEDGNIYINASYLTTGILKSADGTSFYLDLVNGILKGKFAEFYVSGKSVEEIAGEAQKNAEEYADKAVSNQTQTDIYNKLTANGTAQGIFFENGQLYINASFLVAGILQSLDNTTFYLDLVNGVLKGNFAELSVDGKKATWKSNGDGTFTLIGQ
jgi:hypothetical protein